MKNRSKAFFCHHPLLWHSCCPLDNNMERNTLQYGIVTWSGPLQPSAVQAIRHRVERTVPALAGMEWRHEGYSPSSMITLTARRANLANMGREARATLRFSSLDCIDVDDVERWTRAIVDVLDTTVGDVMIDARGGTALVESETCADMGVCYSRLAEEAPASMPVAKRAPQGARPRKRTFDSCKAAASQQMVIVDRTTELDRQEDDRISTLDRQQQRALDELQAAIINYITTYHADPRELMLKLQGKVIVNGEASPLVVNQDMDIVLPYYNELVVEMPAMCKAIYILFLCHPEGIVLKQFGDYRAELEQVYNIVMPNRDEALARESIDNLCSPMTNTLNEYIAKIKRSFRRYVLNGELLEQYVIAGQRGKPYRVALSPDLITLPKAFTA